MGSYESLRRKAPIPVHENADLPEDIKGLYIETTNRQAILLNKSIPLLSEKYCVLAEEIGHYYTSAGNILDQSDIRNRKQEKRARNWAYERLVPFACFIEAFHANARNRYEFAELIGVTEEFLEASIVHYQEVYGLSVQVGGYVISFDPLGVTKLIR
ncbi:ImmA/IrrE family metallo-endopeptidase [Paenibacillus spiritus]|uniref:ImmA/IrrE family metallo-endopeptidase n=1 Tax=Paenibacillus spiritus TaxID=2496557 RepID=A0A5J5G8Q7_9BACL|nr:MULTISPECIES: ImmA/IrrE family metallo-endopeptidase [Paenibacillus]KAA9003981.1 ImmA/IrrE family metallo-endopeptidase [Paenibacillus spiritus]